MQDVQALLEHEHFTRANPNRFRSLVGAFAAANPTGFHATDGSGYRLVGEEIAALDSRNPQVAARLATCFSGWRRQGDARGALMREVLQGLMDRPGLSRDVGEVVGRSLART